MEIKYSVRSRFVEPAVALIQEHRAILDAGELLAADMMAGGYAGRVIVTIDTGHADTFGSNWSRADPTRFPARIKAVATALRKCNIVGCFEISHSNGALTIRRLSEEGALESNVRTIYLISCVSQKAKRASAAKDLYVSVWFRRARAYVEALCCRWFILSAEHGLLDPESERGPYERTLNEMSVAMRRDWAKKVFKEISAAVPDLSQVVFLAGARYREFLVPLMKNHNIHVSVPMKGMGIGKQLQWLNQEIEKSSHSIL